MAAAPAPWEQTWDTSQPATPAAPVGPTPDPNNPNIYRNPDSSIAYIGAPPSQTTAPTGGPVEINVGGTSNPDAIAEYLKAHPDDPANHIAPPAPAPAPTSSNTPPTAESDAPWAMSWGGGAPGPDSPEARAAASAQAGSASIPSPVRSAVQGMTFNLGDELAGAGAWAGNAVGQLVNKFTGHHTDITPAMAYDAQVKAERDAQDNFAKAHPWENAGIEAAGSMANPVSWLGGGFIGGARSLGGAALRSAVVGGGLGALAGAGDGADIGSRAGGALSGAATGATVGAAVPFAGAAIGAAGRSMGFVGGSSAAQAAREAAAAKSTLGRMGVDYSALPATAQSQITQNVGAGRVGSDAAVQAMADSLPVRVPLTSGQMSGEPGQQLEENLALRGARGQPAQIIAKGFQQQQQGALRANVDQIGANIGGGFPTARGQAGETVSDALNSRYDAANANVGKAYDAARGAESPAYLHPTDAHSLVANVRSGLADFDPLNVPRVAREVDRFADQAAPWAKDLPPGINPSRVSSVSGAKPADVRTLFEGRTRLAKLRTSADPVEAAAAKSVVAKFDQSIDHAMTEDLFNGDPKTVDMWRDAIGLRREFGGVFQSNDLVHKLTERQGFGTGASLKVDPHDASNYIFGRSNLGFVGRQNLYRGLNKLRDVLGSDSDGWSRIRGEAFARIAQAGEGPMEGGAAQFSGAKFSTAWTKAKAEDPNLISTLFKPGEVATIDRFAVVANRATKAVTGGDNASNTAAATKALGALKRLPFVAIESVPFIDHFADKIDNAVRTRAITRATTGAQPRLSGSPASAQWGKALTPPAVAGFTAYDRSTRK